MLLYTSLKPEGYGGVKSEAIQKSFIKLEKAYA
jgi:hypothetical protein